MQTGTYKTTDPNVRIRVVVDEEYPTEDPDFPYAEGVLEELQKSYEEGNYYGVIVERREPLKSTEELVQIILDNEVLDTWEERIEQAIQLGRVQEIYRDVWEEEDSIWSCAGYENVAEEVAKEFFGITVTGKM